MRRPGMAALIVAGAVAAGALAHALGDEGGAEPQRPRKPRLRSRFDRLTSHVWRYQAPFERRDLAPVPNNNPLPEPQPHRDRPERLALDATGSKVYVALAGTEAEPGSELAVVDLETRAVLGRIPVGSRPYALVLHPGGRFLVVTNELSNYATVIDTHGGTSHLTPRQIEDLLAFMAAVP